MKMIIFAIIQIRGHGNGALKAIHSSSADPPWFSIYAARPQNLLTLDNTQHQIYFRMICLDQPSENTANTKTTRSSLKNVLTYTGLITMC